MDECIPYEEFSHFLDKRYMNKKKFYIDMYHTKHVKILYKKDISNVGPLKPKFMKLT